jgi:hypothetical protein
MDNPFREVLDTDAEVHNMKLPYYAKTWRNIMLLFETDLSDLEYEYAFQQYREVHPDVCTEREDDSLERALEFLENLRANKKDVE